MIGVLGCRQEDVDINRAYNTSVNKKRTTSTNYKPDISLKKKHKLQV
jgi:hypothetical protein